MRAARAAGVAVPAVRDLATVDGRPGLIMDRVDGIDLCERVTQRVRGREDALQRVRDCRATPRRLPPTDFFPTLALTKRCAPVMRSRSASARTRDSRTRTHG